MADPKDINGATVTIVDKQAAQWAREDTLKKIAASSGISANLLDLLGKKLGVGDKAIEEAIKSAEESARDSGTKVSRTLEHVPKIFDESGKLNRQALRDVSLEITSGLASLTKAADAKTLFGSLGSQVGQIGKLFSEMNPIAAAFVTGLGATVAEIGVYYEKITELTKTTENLYATGLVFRGGMQGMADAASAAGLSVSEFGKILSNYGAAAATLGVNRISNLNAMFLKQTNLGADLMMTQQEASESFMQTIEMMRSSGQLVGRSNESIVKTGKDLLTSYNDLAQATGRNRDEILKTTNAMAKMPNIDILLRAMNPDDALQFNKTLADVSATFGDKVAPELGSMVAQIRLAHGSFGTLPGDMATIITRIGGLGDAFRDASNDIPGAAQRMAQLLDSPETRQKLAQLANTYPEAAAKLTELSQASRQAAETQQRRSKMTDAEIDDEKQRKADAERALAVNNKVTAAFSRFGNAFDKLAVSLSNIILPAVDAVSYSFETLASWVNKITGLISGGGAGGTIAEIVTAAVPTVLAVMYSSKGIGGLLRVGKRLASSGLGALGGAGKALGELPGAATKGMGSMLGGAGRALGGVPKYAGSLLKEIAQGVEAFGSPRVLLGAVAIAGLAGDLYLFAKAMKEFNDVSWSSLAKAGVVMVAAGLGMETFATAVAATSAILAANVVDIGIAELLLAGFGAAMIPFAYAMNLAAPAITAFGTAIGTIFASLRGVSWATLLAAGPAIGELTVALSAASAAAPFIWIGSKVMANAIERIGEGIATAVQNSGPAAINGMVESIGKIAGIDGGALEKTAKGLRTIASVMTFDLPFMNMTADSGAIAEFAKIFKQLGDAKEDIIKGAGTVAALGTINLSADKMAGISRLTDMFSSYGGTAGGALHNLFNSTIDPDKITKFTNMFSLLGDKEEDIVKGSNALRAISDNDITEDKVKGFKVLSEMFSKGAGNLGGWLYRMFHSEIDPGLVSKFTQMFAALGRGREQIISGAGSLAAMFSIKITSDKVAGMNMLADMFSSTWIGKLFKATIDPSYVAGFVAMFAELAKGEDTIVSGSNALQALMDIPVSKEKIDSFAQLLDMFSSTGIGKIFKATVDPSYIDGFTKLFEIFGQAKEKIIGGIGTLAALFSININMDKLTAISKLNEMFGDFGNTTRTLKNVDGFVSVFQRFADSENTIISGVNAINAISDLDLTGINQLHDLNAAIFGSGAPIVVPAATSTPTVSAAIDSATTDYYAKTIGQFDKMIELLTIANANAQKLISIETDGFAGMTSAINSASGTIY